MQLDTGRIAMLSGELALASLLAERKYSSRHRSRDARTVPMVLEPTQKQLARMRVGRNDPCPCGSGVKFKKCCYRTQP